MNSKYEKQLEFEFEEFLKLVGVFLKREREYLGHTSAESFGNEIDIEGSTIRSYESGKGRMTLQRFYTLLRGLNKTKEDVFTAIITGEEPAPDPVDFRLTPEQEQQVRQHLKSVLSEKHNSELTADSITRLYLMLRYCHNKKLRKAELKKKFRLTGKGYTKNFNAVLKTAIEAKWIILTNPTGKQDRNQQYYTSSEGVKVLNFGN